MIKYTYISDITARWGAPHLEWFRSHTPCLSLYTLFTPHLSMADASLNPPAAARHRGLQFEGSANEHEPECDTRANASPESCRRAQCRSVRSNVGGGLNGSAHLRGG